MLMFTNAGDVAPSERLPRRLARSASLLCLAAVLLMPIVPGWVIGQFWGLAATDSADALTLTNSMRQVDRGSFENPSTVTKTAHQVNSPVSAKSNH